MKHPPIVRTLLKAAKKQKLTPIALASKGKIDYSSCHRMLNGKATRPSFVMVEGLAKVTGFKIMLEMNKMVQAQQKVVFKGMVKLAAKRKKV